MIIKSKKLIDGVYSLYFKNYNLSGLKNVNKNILKFNLSEIASYLNLKIIDFDVWNDNLQKQDNKIIFDWHNDMSDKIDTLLLIYFTDKVLNEKTGGRIGFKHNNIEKMYNIKSDRCFLVKQDKDYLHKVEAAKLIFKNRICISVSLSGWKNLELNE
jgi:hypothetical protein